MPLAAGMAYKLSYPDLSGLPGHFHEGFVYGIFVSY
jgi:hypothetical protein